MGKITRFTVKGGAGDDGDFRSKKKVFKPNTRDTVLYTRNPREEFRLVITVSGTEGRVFLPARDQVTPAEFIGTWEGRHIETNGATYRIRFVIANPDPDTGNLVITQTEWYPDKTKPENSVTAVFEAKYSKGVLTRVEMPPGEEQEFRVNGQSMTGKYWTFDRNHLKAVYDLTKAN
jgi:hypothetical protein